MRNRIPLILFVLVLLSGPASWSMDSRVEPDQKARAFAGQDLHLRGREIISYQLNTGEQLIVFQDGFSMSIGANQFSSNSAVIWLQTTTTVFRGRAHIDYEAIIYMQGNISVKQAKAAKTTDLKQIVVEQGRVMAVRFGVSGDVFVTADTIDTTDPRGLELYAGAFKTLQTAGIGPMTVEAQPQEPELPSVEEGLEKPAEELVEPTKKPVFRYPINLSPVGEAAFKVEWDDDQKIGTVIGRFYLWQKQDEKGGLLELQVDNAVIFSSLVARGSSLEKETQYDIRNTHDDILAAGAVKAIYLSGDVVMTQGRRTIRADEIYYDFEEKKAIAINAVMRNFDVNEGIPIYIRAEKLRQMAENQFTADNITLTTSEFFVPQVSLNASNITLIDTTIIDEQEGKVSNRSYDARIRDVRFKMYDNTLFYWPYVRSNLQRPDIPLKSVHAGYDSTWGALVETRWYLARLLGLQEPEGTDSTLALDYYGERGFGGGIETNYERENYFGRILGYMIHDSGEDRLGRHSSRRDLEPPRELRGRFHWQHKHFLPYNWQLTTELSYASDENFIEGFYRSEFNIGKEQETLIYLKRIEDNWALSLLGKARINDFVNKLEELPTAEFHWTGQSLLDDKLTFYSDTQVSVFRRLYASSNQTPGSQEFFSLAATRNELNMPITVEKVQVVPFVAGTVAYEDGAGFYTELDGGRVESQKDVWFGEAGLRLSSQPYWKVYPDVKSRLWDLNQLRHIIRPHLTAVGYTQNDSVVEQRDTLNVGISQRLQTKRGSDEKQRTVDWMRLDLDVTWVEDSGDASAGADRFIWNKPFIPLVNRFSPLVPLRDRRSSNIFGPRRNYFGADYMWRMSDTTAVLSDMYLDMKSGLVQQLNVGFSHMRWPDLSYYIGTRYLRRVQILDEEGSNAFTFAVTYVLDPRYTVAFSQQYDFEYGANIQNELTIIRRYHRVYCGLTYSVDSSLDQHAFIFSIWPQGVPELAIGPKRYMEINSYN